MAACAHKWSYGAIFPHKRSDGATLQHRRCEICRLTEVFPTCTPGVGADVCKHGARCPNRCKAHVEWVRLRRREVRA